MQAPSNSKNKKSKLVINTQISNSSFDENSIDLQGLIPTRVVCQTSRNNQQQDIDFLQVDMPNSCKNKNSLTQRPLQNALQHAIKRAVKQSDKTYSPTNSHDNYQQSDTQIQIPASVQTENQKPGVFKFTNEQPTQLYFKTQTSNSTTNPPSPKVSQGKNQVPLSSKDRSAGSQSPQIITPKNASQPTQNVDSRLSNRKSPTPRNYEVPMIQQANFSRSSPTNRSSPHFQVETQNNNYSPRNCFEEIQPQISSLCQTQTVDVPKVKGNQGPSFDSQNGSPSNQTYREGCSNPHQIQLDLSSLLTSNNQSNQLPYNQPLNQNSNTNSYLSSNQSQCNTYSLQNPFTPSLFSEPSNHIGQQFVQTSIISIQDNLKYLKPTSNKYSDQPQNYNNTNDVQSVNTYAGVSFIETSEPYLNINTQLYKNTPNEVANCQMIQDQAQDIDEMIINKETLQFLKQNFLVNEQSVMCGSWHKIPLVFFIKLIVKEYSDVLEDHAIHSDLLSDLQQKINKLVQNDMDPQFIDLFQLGEITKQTGVLGLLLRGVKQLNDEESDKLMRSSQLKRQNRETGISKFASLQTSRCCSQLVLKDSDAKNIMNILQEFMQSLFKEMEDEIYSRLNVQMRKMILKYRETERLMNIINEKVTDNFDLFKRETEVNQRFQEFEAEQSLFLTQIRTLQHETDRLNLRIQGLVADKEKYLVEIEKLNEKCDKYHSQLFDTLKYTTSTRQSISPLHQNSAQKPSISLTPTPYSKFPIEKLYKDSSASSLLSKNDSSSMINQNQFNQSQNFLFKNDVLDTSHSWQQNQSQLLNSNSKQFFQDEQNKLNWGMNQQIKQLDQTTNSSGLVGNLSEINPVTLSLAGQQSSRIFDQSLEQQLLYKTKNSLIQNEPIKTSYVIDSNSQNMKSNQQNPVGFSQSMQFAAVSTFFPSHSTSDCSVLLKLIQLILSKVKNSAIYLVHPNLSVVESEKRKISLSRKFYKTLIPYTPNGIFQIFRCLFDSLPIVMNHEKSSINSFKQYLEMFIKASLLIQEVQYNMNELYESNSLGEPQTRAKIFVFSNELTNQEEFQNFFISKIPNTKGWIRLQKLFQNMAPAILNLNSSSNKIREESSQFSSNKKNSDFSQGPAFKFSYQTQKVENILRLQTKLIANPELLQLFVGTLIETAQVLQSNLNNKIQPGGGGNDASHLFTQGLFSQASYEKSEIEVHYMDKLATYHAKYLCLMTALLHANRVSDILFCANEIISDLENEGNCDVRDFLAQNQLTSILFILIQDINENEELLEKILKLIMLIKPTGSAFMDYMNTISQPWFIRIILDVSKRSEKLRNPQITSSCCSILKTISYSINLQDEFTGIIAETLANLNQKIQTYC